MSDALDYHALKRNLVFLSNSLSIIIDYSPNSILRGSQDLALHSLESLQISPSQVHIREDMERMSGGYGEVVCATLSGDKNDGSKAITTVWRRDRSDPHGCGVSDSVLPISRISPPAVTASCARDTSVVQAPPPEHRALDRVPSRYEPYTRVAHLAIRGERQYCPVSVS